MTEHGERNGASGVSRGRTRQVPSLRTCRTIAITSGKGGVGKTSIAVNLAVALAQLEQRVAILDADYGLGNVDILLGLEVDRTLEQVLLGGDGLGEVLTEGPEGVLVVPSATGVQSLTRLTDRQEAHLLRCTREIGALADYLVVDTATGISSNVVSWLGRASDVVVVTSPDPTAIVDAYAVLKIQTQIGRGKPLRLLVNGVQDASEAAGIHERLSLAVRHFLHANLGLLGHVVKDPEFDRATRLREPLVTLRPASPASRCLRRLAQRLVGSSLHPALAPTPEREGTELEVLEAVVP